jgi:hypothetical protein
LVIISIKSSLLSFFVFSRVNLLSCIFILLQTHLYVIIYLFCCVFLHFFLHQIFIIERDPISSSANRHWWSDSWFIKLSCNFVFIERSVG